MRCDAVPGTPPGAFTLAEEPVMDADTVRQLVEGMAPIVSTYLAVQIGKWMRWRRAARGGLL